MDPRYSLTHPTAQTMVTVEDRSPSNRVVAFILAFFFGFWGFHRFYVGKPLTGILYFFTGALFGFGWFWDLFMIGIGRFRDGQDRVLGPPQYAPRAQLVGAPAPDLKRHVEEAKKKSEEDYYLEEAMKDPLEEKFDALEKEFKGTDGNVW